VLVEALGRVWRVPHVENQLKAGQQATLVVRPEAVNLGEADQYPLEARVTHYTYLGPIAEYNLELPGGQTLLAAVSILGQPRMAKVGEIVSVELVETALAALAE
jgi:ABC-type Fe3+/spermidine/putrescine transport system ATPase subunit